MQNCLSKYIYVLYYSIYGIFGFKIIQICLFLVCFSLTESTLFLFAFVLSLYNFSLLAWVRSPGYK